MFDAIHNFYTRSSFCDLKIQCLTTGGNGRTSEFYCHRLVLAGALPGFKDVLQTVSAQEDDGQIILTLADVDSSKLKQTLDSIYHQLLGGQPKLEGFTEQWLHSFHLNAVKIGTDRDKTDEESALMLNPCQNVAGIVSKSIQNVPSDLSKNSSLKECQQSQFCPYCLQTFPFLTQEQKSDFLAHKRTHLVCTLCNRALKYVKDFEDHLSSVHGVRTFHCGVGGCTSEYRRLQDLNSHRTSRHAPPDESSSGHVPCGVCRRVFASAHAADSHRAGLHQKMKCRMCGHVSLGSQAAEKHLLEAHRSPAVCEDCGKTFRSKKTLRTHRINAHTPDRERPFRCDLCDRGFLNSGRLRDHVARDHEGKRQYPCRSPGCVKSFTLANVRKKHEKRSHKLTIDLRKGAKCKAEIFVN